MAKKQRQDLAVDMFAGQDLSEGGAVPIVRATSPLPERGDYRLVTAAGDLDALTDAIDEARSSGTMVSFDTEFSGAGVDVNIHLPGVKLVGLSVGVPGVSWYVPLAHRHTDGVAQLPHDLVRARLNGRLAAARLASHNGKIDVSALVYAGWSPLPITFDTYTAAHFLEWKLSGEQAQRWARWHGDNPAKFFYKKSLKDLATNELDIDPDELITFEHVIARSGQQNPKRNPDFSLVSLDDARIYVGQDADLTSQLAERWRPLIDGSFLEPIYRRITMPLLGVLGKMERRGFYVDPAHYEEVMGRYAAEIARHDTTLERYLGRAVGWKTDAQLRYLLYTHLGLPVRDRTKTGVPAVGKSAMQELLGYAMYEWRRPGTCPLATREELVAVITTLQKRAKLSKLVSTYDMRLHASDWIEVNGKQYGVVHTQYNESGTATGRKNSVAPNAQNLPAKGDGKDIRNGVVALAEWLESADGQAWGKTPEAREILGEGQRRRVGKQRRDWYYLVADLSQIEPRCMAFFIALLGDTTLLDSYQAGRDIYKTIAAAALDKDYDDVTDAERSAAKILVLALAYGSSAAGLASNPLITALGLDVKGVEQALETLFKNIPGLRLYHWNAIAWGLYRGYTESLWGFARSAADLRSARRDYRTGAVRALINHVIQSFAAQIIDAAMVWIDDILTRYGLEDVIKLTLQVHDEIDSQVRGDYLVLANAILNKCMRQVVDLGAPLKIDVEVGVLDDEGSRWGNLIALKDVELPPQHPETELMLQWLETEPNPFADMPLAQMATPFDLSIVADEDLPIYLWHAANLNVTLNDSRLPQCSLSRPQGWIVDAKEYQPRDERGRRYYRATIIGNGGMVRLHSRNVPLVEGPGQQVYGKFSDTYGTFDVESVAPLDPDLVIREALRNGTPVARTPFLIHCDQLRAAIDEAQQALVAVAA